ncbi:MAG: substrate-binding domain-containing protein [Desulfofustis sp. PB-SRB1]|jgi:tungstate transport system substrate-binding protein|nr:substrate-binding domain-containing protein [Desulfofustis sp. PB-SRB1]MBM1003335.1 substrate-binding domain-containing protein [Desulfofustis sp. PB-SRB1]HBH27619.1 tungsten ABC transporter substrate-binding protein [Desulfofustis sp.]HBH30888.1 tungsten ABC transporter substrate-binding protein [Desulfofustis sp.]
MRVTLWAALAGLIMMTSVAVTAAADEVITMSTTTSTQASGLLDILLPQFTEASGIEVKVVAKGTGAAIRDGMDGNVDVIFVHAREREEQFVAEGYGTKRYAVMHNDFVIVGPADDPAGVRGSGDVQEAMKRIADHSALFVSRGDDSGTHTKEQQIWRLSGVPTEEVGTEIVKGGTPVTLSFVVPADSEGWYRSIGQGMGKVLTFADEMGAYTLTDRGTFIKYKYGIDPPISLEIVNEGAPELANPYGVIPVNPEKFPHVKYDQADTFARWLVSEQAQQLIGSYRLEGKQLFFPDAIAQ